MTQVVCSLFQRCGVLQEVKQEADSIVNILENMKEEDPAAGSPLDYTVPSSPLNLAGCKGVKRVMSSGPGAAENKRLKNVLVLQTGQQILHQLPVTAIHGYTGLNTAKASNSDMDDEMGSLSYMDPPSPKSENKAKNAALKMTYPTKTVAGTVIPSSKTCNWVFENGQVCGKTFSKSYNLVVHMRMHEDIRPFACTLCDQTFRQKAHLQRHETTHGIQSKNFYRNPPGGGRRRKRGNPKMSKGLQERLNSAQGFRKKMNGADSEGEEMVEDEEDDVYVPNGSPAKRTASARKYSNSDCQGEDIELDSDTALYEGGGGKDEPTHAGSSQDRRKYISRENLQVGDGEMITALNLAQRQDDDDTSTVQDILHTVNSVPTLEQKLESSYCESLLLKSRSSQHLSRLVDSGSLSSLTLSNNNLPSTLSTTLSQHLPGSSLAQTNILYTTLSGSNSKLLSLMESSPSRNQLIIENLEDHSPEIQAELLNALLADETYGQEEICQEEIYRLNTLPSSWWVLRRRKQGSFPADITYYSPQGFGFKTKAEIQNFLQHNLITRETKNAGLRQPPIPIESIPVIDDDLPSVQSSLDANSIAQVLIANLKPEPLERIQEALSETNSVQDSLSNPGTPSQQLLSTS